MVSFRHPSPPPLEEEEIEAFQSSIDRTSIIQLVQHIFQAIQNDVIEELEVTYLEVNQADQNAEADENAISLEDSELVKTMLPLLELSANEDQARYLCRLAVPEVMTAIAIKARVPRTVEVSVGVLANLARVLEGQLALAQFEGLSQWCCQYILSSSDAQSLHEILRLVEGMLFPPLLGEGWVSELEDTGAAQQLIFFLESTLNDQLCQRTCSVLTRLVCCFAALFTSDDYCAMLKHCDSLIASTWLSTSSYSAVISLLDYVTSNVTLPETLRHCPELPQHLVVLMSEHREDFSQLELSVVLYVLSDMIASPLTGPEIVESIARDRALVKFLLEQLYNHKTLVDDDDDNSDDNETITEAVLLLTQIVVVRCNDKVLHEGGMVHLLAGLGSQLHHLSSLPWTNPTRNKLHTLLKAGDVDESVIKAYQVAFDRCPVAEVANVQPAASSSFSSSSSSLMPQALPSTTVETSQIGRELSSKSLS